MLYYGTISQKYLQTVMQTIYLYYGRRSSVESGHVWLWLSKSKTESGFPRLGSAPSLTGGNILKYRPPASSLFSSLIRLALQRLHLGWLSQYRDNILMSTWLQLIWRSTTIQLCWH